MRSEHVLLLCRDFPPSAAVGARRGLRFARGLAGEGFRVSVITVHETLYPQMDPSQRLGEGEPFRVIRTGTLNPIALGRARQSSRTVSAGPATAPAASPGGPSTAQRIAAHLRSLLRPDEDVLWNPLAVRAALRLHRRDPIDVVITSMPPYSTLRAACAVGRRTGARVVADYRDPWAVRPDQDPSYKPWHRRVEARMERALLARTHLALFTSPSARDFYRARHPDGPPMIALFNSVDRYLDGEGPPSDGVLYWAHAGNLYRGQRSLRPVLEAMAEAGGGASTMRIQLIGDAGAEELPIAERLGLRDCIEPIGRLPLAECLARLRRAHRLLAIVSDDHPLQVPAKVFDYLGTRRPILLLAPK